MLCNILKICTVNPMQKPFDNFCTKIYQTDQHNSIQFLFMNRRKLVLLFFSIFYVKSIKVLNGCRIVWVLGTSVKLFLYIGVDAGWWFKPSYSPIVRPQDQLMEQPDSGSWWPLYSIGSFLSYFWSLWSLFLLHFCIENLFWCEVNTSW